MADQQVTIYHNPRCKKSKETLQLLKDNGVKPEIIEYLNTPPSKAELQRLLDLMGIKPYELIRRQEKIFKENYKGKELSDDEWLDVLINNPKLIERPIVVKGDKAAIGRPPENALEVIQ